MNIFFSLTKTYLTTNNQEYQEYTFRVSVRYDIEESMRMDGKYVLLSISKLFENMMAMQDKFFQQKMLVKTMEKALI